MNKLFFTIVIGLVFFMLLVSCSFENVHPENEYQKKIPADYVIVNEHANDPPYVLLFDSYEQMAELKSLSDEPDDIVVLQYLDDDEHSYNMNGIHSKSDIISTFNKINDVSIIYFDEGAGFTLASLIYYVEYGYIRSLYTDDDMKIEILCYLNDSQFLSQSDKTNSPDTPKEMLNVGTCKIRMYEAEPDSRYSLVGGCETDNSYIYVLIQSKNKMDTMNSLITDHMRIASLSEVISK